MLQELPTGPPACVLLDISVCEIDDKNVDLLAGSRCSGIVVKFAHPRLCNQS
jgi:hypothetical protein